MAVILYKDRAVTLADKWCLTRVSSQNHENSSLFNKICDRMGFGGTK